MCVGVALNIVGDSTAKVVNSEQITTLMVLKILIKSW